MLGTAGSCRKGRKMRKMRDVAEFFKTLGDETRLRMLAMLFHHQELCVCDFMEVLNITQSKASRHLRNLYHAGLVTDRKEATWSYYSLRKPNNSLVQAHLETLRKSLADHKDIKDILKNLDDWLNKNERAITAQCSRSQLDQQNQTSEGLS